MNLLKKRNDTLEYKTFKKYQTDIENLKLKDKYISKKEYMCFYDNKKELFDKLSLMDRENVLLSWCKNNKTD